MIIKIDMRERELIEEVNKLLPNYEGIEIKIENLPLGDMILSSDDKDFIILERKTVADLSASIKDGRYEEQSFRLNGLSHPNHNIIYIIEGAINSSTESKFRGNFKFKAKETINPTTIYSAMFSLNFFKGFSVFRTFGLDETALFLCNSANKLKKELANGKTLFHSEENKTSNATTESVSKDYIDVVKKVKKENINKENIGEIMLCQIPGISSTTAKAIMEKFHNIPNLVKCLNENKDCMADLCNVLANGQKRKISKSCIQSVVEYLGSE